MESKFEKEIGLKPICADKIEWFIGKDSVAFGCILPKGHEGLHGCVGWDKNGKQFYLRWGTDEEWEKIFNGGAK